MTTKLGGICCRSAAILWGTVRLSASWLKQGTMTLAADDPASAGQREQDTGRQAAIFAVGHVFCGDRLLLSYLL